jgi:DNA-binding protein H-NS
VSQLQAKLEEALKENHILKRAVQIQNARVQEASQKDQEIQHLNQVINQHREQLRNLELSNYSLSLHLQQATNGGAFGHHRNPDVF